MADAFDNYYFASNITGYLCAGFSAFQCVPPNACARDSSTGLEYCCDYLDVCWAGATSCATDGTTRSCGGGSNSWCCLQDSAECTQTENQINICWASSHDTLTNISSTVLNDTYSSLSSASPSATSWTFTPSVLIALTSTAATTPTSSVTATQTSATPTSATSTSSSATAPTSTASHSALSTAAQAGIGVGVSVAGIAAITVAVLWLVRRRRRMAGGYPEASAMSPTAGGPPPKEPTLYGNELSAGYVPSELMGNQPQAYELPAR